MNNIAATITDDIRRLEPGDEPDLRYESPSLLTQISYATKLSALKGANASRRWYKGWQYWLHPPETGPDIVKNYDIKPILPVRIFLPSSYDHQTTYRTLPTLFTIHGGGFCIGEPSDDDMWNRTFSDENNVLVIALNYAKAPFPAPLHDVACLFLACAEDPSLPIDVAWVAVAGFSAGGNLALGLCQLRSVRGHSARPRAVIPLYPPVDASRRPEEKAATRYYKVDSGLAGVRGEASDWVHPLAALFDWAYIPPGTSLRHPLLSPLYADRRHLPGCIFVIAAELDYLADEAQQLAFRIAGKERDPSYNDIPGRPEASKEEGKLELEDPRFAWEDRGVRWLLVPDVVHAFDFHVGAEIAGEGAVGDAEGKTRAYMGFLAEWLYRTVWV